VRWEREVKRSTYVLRESGDIRGRLSQSSLPNIGAPESSLSKNDAGGEDFSPPPAHVFPPEN